MIPPSIAARHCPKVQKRSKAHELSLFYASKLSFDKSQLARLVSILILGNAKVYNRPYRFNVNMGISMTDFESHFSFAMQVVSVVGAGGIYYHRTTIVPALWRIARGHADRNDIEMARDLRQDPVVGPGIQTAARAFRQVGQNEEARRLDGIEART